MPDLNDSEIVRGINAAFEHDYRMDDAQLRSHLNERHGVPRSVVARKRRTGLTGIHSERHAEELDDA